MTASVTLEYNDGMTKAADANVYFNGLHHRTTSSNAKKDLAGIRISAVMNVIDHQQFAQRKRYGVKRNVPVSVTLTMNGTARAKANIWIPKRVNAKTYVVS